MPLTFTAAHSSRVSKPKTKNKAFDRAAATAFASAARRKPGAGPSQSQSQSRRKNGKNTVDPDSDSDEERLEDLGLVKQLESDLALRDVVPTMAHARQSMFDEVPLERSGMNSTRTAEVLRFRAALPPLVTNAHVHALVKSPTSVEREIAALGRKGIVRRVVVPGRGVGAAAFGDALVRVDEWIELAKGRGLDPEVEEAYTAFLRSGATDAAALGTQVSAGGIAQLMSAGLLTASSAALRASTSAFAPLQPGAAGTATSIAAIARAASGSGAAVGGGTAAPLDTGGGGQRGLRDGAAQNTEAPPKDLTLAVPNAGAYLKLLSGARAHLVAMLAKSRYREAPAYLMRERWDGTTATKAAYGRQRDPFAAVLPGKTRKWKDFYGLRFDWVLAECLGAGLVEVFETGSVGLGVRCL